MNLKQKEWYTVEQCENNPQNLYVFGDNTNRFGKGGQAQIRYCNNSFGIATKVSPSTSVKSYFTDSPEHLEIVTNDIKKLKEASLGYENIIFPYDGLGSGLSDMPNKCPELYKSLNRMLKEEFGVDYE